MRIWIRERTDFLQLTKERWDRIDRKHTAVVAGIAVGLVGTTVATGALLRIALQTRDAFPMAKTLADIPGLQVATVAAMACTAIALVLTFASLYDTFGIAGNVEAVADDAEALPYLQPGVEIPVDLPVGEAR